MKNWKYIEGAKTGNIDINDMRSEKEKIIKQIKDLKDERAGWLRYQETHKDDAQLAEKIKGYTKEISDLQNKLLKVGNDTPWEYAHRKPKVINDDKIGAEEFFKQLSDDVKEREKKAANSASDDKFAYVMREFDEGKLKTPDGKVVTDPAQAKAIAYSESKKTENGLARARKAIK